jgi:NAD(P)-dependent dehydrogenase (short-subunit alcohol dehydrogenase family)
VPAEPAGTPVPAFTRDTVVVTATPSVLGSLGESPGDPLVLSTTPCAPGVRRRHVTDLSAAGVRTLMEDAQDARHLRIVADLESLLPGAQALTGDWSDVAALHDLAFLTLQAMHDALNQPGSSALGLFLRGDCGTGLHPFAGLFSGLLKTVALELPECVTTSVFTSEGSIATGRAQLEAETAVRRDLPLVAYRAGVRHALVVRDEPPVAATVPQLGPGDVVVAVGGGHGITAELLQQVVARTSPTVYVVGSTPVDELAPRVEAVGGPAALADRAEFLRSRRAAEPGSSVPSLNAEYDRLRRAAEVMANLESLRRLCGAGRVHYRCADVLDRSRLRDVVDEIAARHGQVGLVIHAAGINRSGALATKPVEAYREVRAVKVGGYCNLQAAFAGRPPRMWCSFGSFIGLTGQIGEADYASANDFLTTAAAAMRRERREEFTVGWTLWDEIGMGSHPVTRAFLAKSGVFTRMSTAEGVAHFAEELNAGNRAAATFHLGEAERAAIAAKLPRFLERSDGPDRPLHVDRPFYLDRVVEQDEHHLVAERRFDNVRDRYLEDHLVAGAPTLPGLFVPEIAAEAAAALLPGLRVIGFRDLSFDRFLKLVPALTGSPRRIEATLTARSRDAATVRVEVTGDVTAANGVVLQAGVRHFTVTVVLAEDYPHPVVWPGLGAGPETPVADPYHVADAPVVLTGPFVTTRHTRMHALGKRAQYVSPVPPGDDVFGRFLVPSLLLDGLARVAAIDLVAGRYVPVAAPRSIRRIDLYEDGSDAALGGRYPHLELTVTPADLRLDAGEPNRFVACRPDGHVVAQMHDVKGVVLGYIDTETGAAVDRTVVDGHPRRAVYLRPVAAL